MGQSSIVPKVTVCVITYNQEKYIRQCLQSIVDQKTDFEFEVIVGDDCSSDGTAEIVREFTAKYPGKIFPIYQSSNVGNGVHNYLTVHNAARGRYVAHVDGDDYLLPGKIQRQSEFLDENEGFSAVWHKVNIENEKFCKIGITGDLREIYSNGIVTLDKLLRYGAAGVHSTLMYRRTARVTSSPGFDVLDLFYSLELLESGDGMLLNEVLGAFRVVEQSINNRKREKVRALCAHHMLHFYRRHLNCRKDVFIYSLANAAIDIVRRRRSSLAFIKLALRTFMIISPREFFVYAKNLTKLR